MKMIGIVSAWENKGNVARFPRQNIVLGAIMMSKERIIDESARQFIIASYVLNMRAGMRGIGLRITDCTSLMRPRGLMHSLSW